MAGKKSEWQEESRGDKVRFEKAGDEISGRFVRLEENVGKNHSNVYHFENADGEAVSCFGCSQIDEFMKGRKEGDQVRIVYTGEKVKTKSGFKVKLYKFYTKK